MTSYHQSLADGRWQQMTLCEQMANIGSEISRALNWKNKNKSEMSQKAAARALDLLDLELESVHTFFRIREIARLREVIVDYFYGSNTFSSSEQSLRRYFDHFLFACKR